MQLVLHPVHTGVDVTLHWQSVPVADLLCCVLDKQMQKGTIRVLSSSKYNKKRAQKFS